MRLLVILHTYVTFVVGDVSAEMIWRDMWEFTLERDLMFVNIVDELSKSNTTWKIMLEFTWKI